MLKDGSRYGILVGIDGSEESDSAVRWAVSEARLIKAPITLVHVVPPMLAPMPKIPVEAMITEWDRERADGVMEAARAIVSTVPGGDELDVRTEVQYWGVLPTLIDASRESRMTVVGSRGLGALQRLTMGSVSSGLLRHAHGPVTVVHGVGEPVPDPTLPIVVGIDGSAASTAAATLAFAEADVRGVELVAVHAWRDTGALSALGIDAPMYERVGLDLLEASLAELQSRYPRVRVRRRLESATPAYWLLRESRHAQLLVVGSRGRGGVAGMMLGSVSSAVTRAAQIPVTVVRPR